MIQFVTKQDGRHLINEELIKDTELTSDRLILIHFGDGRTLSFSNDDIDIEGLWRVLEIAMSNRKNVYRVDPGERTKP